jgi:hypothetical protein
MGGGGDEGRGGEVANDIHKRIGDLQNMVILAKDPFNYVAVLYFAMYSCMLLFALSLYL